jgi:uncharacterized protein (UPF0548 family)
MPMLSLRRPTARTISKFLTAQAKLGLTYSAVGATAALPPEGYTVDHTRIKLGEGEEVFSAAQAALGRWDQFRLGWVEAWSPETPIATGAIVAVIARLLGLWWLNACRVVYVVDEEEPIRRFGYSYGTLPDHAETGEERFLIEWDRASGAVWYDILAFSRPHQLMTWLGYPYMRRVQKRFGRGSAAAMVRAVRFETAGGDGSGISGLVIGGSSLSGRVCPELGRIRQPTWLDSLRGRLRRARKAVSSGSSSKCIGPVLVLYRGPALR